MRREIAALDAMLAVGALVAAFFLTGPLLTVGLRIPLGYNEGWNAYLAQRAMMPALGPLYPPADTLVFNNYPPLSFYVVGAVGRYLVGDVIVAGRIVALGALLASAAMLALCVRRLGGSLRGGLAAAILVVLYASVAFPRYVAVDEPQWFGHALALGGLTVLLGGRGSARFGAGRVIAAALLMTASGLVKHLLVGLPLAVTLWLAWEDRRAAAIWLAAAAVAVGGAVLLTDVTLGHDALVDILRHRRIYAWTRILAALLRLLLPLSTMAAIAVLAWRARRPGDAAMRFALLFVACAAVTGLAERAGDGVNYNAHFETLLACALTSGLAISRGVPWRGVTIGPAVLAAIAALPLLVLAPRASVRAWGEIAGRQARAASWRPVIARIAASPRLAGCETLSLCFWAGKPYAVDVFNLEQDIRTGGSIARFDGLARAHGFGVFEFGRGDVTGMRDVLARDLVAHGYHAAAMGPEGSVLLLP